MGKCLKRIGICLLTVCLVWGFLIVADKQTLQNELIRLHVVAASDSEYDQALKLQVRDAVVNSLQENMQNVADAAQAKAYLQENLPKIEALANRVLEEAGCTDTARASLAVEAFATRVYETFMLPSGMYEALRITIGEGEGQNWWCVAFPSLCMSATAEGFEEAASCGGFRDELTYTLEGKDGYEIRFYLLDLLGRIENLLGR
jgi:stage II sporulation protein R